MTDSEDEEDARFAANVSARRDLDAEEGVDMAYRHYTIVCRLLDYRHGEGYAEGHTTIVAALVQAAAQDRLTKVFQDFADNYSGVHYMVMPEKEAQ